MTKQESFKRRIRGRMAATGERYAAARRAMLSPAPPHPRGWAAEPELTDESVSAHTGQGWDEWCRVIEAWPGNLDGHAAIAAYLEREHGLDGWWSQGVTVGYERITGRRLPYQRSDGSFAVGVTRTVPGSADELRDMLLDEQGRAELFPTFDTALRSRPESAAVRLSVGDEGRVLMELADRSDGRVRIAVTHERLPDATTVEPWRRFWTAWLEALDVAP